LQHCQVNKAPASFEQINFLICLFLVIILSFVLDILDNNPIKTEQVLTHLNRDTHFGKDKLERMDAQESKH